jgi:hypothetical protein
MSELRKRQGSGKFNDTGPQNALPRNNDSVLPSVLPGLGCSSLVILISLAAFAAWFLSPEKIASLSHSYAICSSSGARVYTVDHVVPNVQCLVVDGSLILDTGSLGMSKSIQAQHTQPNQTYPWFYVTRGCYGTLGCRRSPSFFSSNTLFGQIFDRGSGA